jgi:hypothetical protein
MTIMKKNLTLLIALFLLQGGFMLKAQVLQADSLALVDFYNAAGGSNWTNQGNWLTGAVPTWTGVTVTGDRVTKLTVAENNMIGTISPSIGNLTELTELRINGNETSRTYIDIHGALPVEFYKLTKLTLVQLKFTKLTEWTQRDSIYKLKALVELNTQATKFGGHLPDSLFTLPNILRLYLHDGNYNGPVPQTLVKATKLTRFYVFGGSKLTNLPYVDIANKGSAKLELTGNYFTFAEVKPYSDVKTQYSGYTNLYQYAGDTVKVTVNQNTKYKLDSKVADGEIFAWLKNPETIPFATDSITYTINSVALADAGTYVCEVQNSVVPSFKILSIIVLNVNPANGIANRSNASFSVYPNPFSDKLQINAASKIDAVGIYNITGKSMLELKNLSGTSASIPVADLKPGVYMIKIKSGNTSSVHKLIKK